MGEHLLADKGSTRVTELAHTCSWGGGGWWVSCLGTIGKTFTESKVEREAREE